VVTQINDNATQPLIPRSVPARQQHWQYALQSFNVKTLTSPSSGALQDYSSDPCLKVGQQLISISRN